MGMVYDVTYPGSRACDKDVGHKYLALIAENAITEPQGRIGARAICTNWDHHVLVLVQGDDGPEWQEQPTRKEMP